jgi:predicted outer membrane repeat protein
MQQGAGVYLNSAHGVLTSDYFSQNSANQGGGIYCSQALVEIYSVQFDGKQNGNNLYCNPGTCTVQHDAQSQCTCSSC